ncbi:collagenase-like [Ostrinia furnacalis]|uniref:collagenase-like n=1 Tax=Ostrinia furnacalis TaxID=93504 RepID=UPI00103F474C|nr:collagenase-like [Ostrinia furnacalis]
MAAAYVFGFLLVFGLVGAFHPILRNEQPAFMEDLRGVSTYIQPCRLQNSQQKNLDYTGVRFTVSGYGRTDDLWNGGAASEILLWVHLRGITNEECRRWYGGSPIVQDQTICAEYYNNTAQSSCQGDSGGPLTKVDVDGQPTMVGIVSFGSSQGCNSPWPSAYVRPGHYHDWYVSVTGINFDWRNEDLLPPASSEEDSSSNSSDDSSDDSSSDSSSSSSSEEAKMEPIFVNA